MNNYLDILPNDICNMIYKIIHKDKMKNILRDIKNFDKFDDLNIIDDTRHTRSTKYKKSIKDENKIYEKWIDYYTAIKKNKNFESNLIFCNFPKYCDFFQSIYEENMSYFIANLNENVEFHMLPNVLWIEFWEKIENVVKVANLNKNVYIKKKKHKVLIYISPK